MNRLVPSRQPSAARLAGPSPTTARTNPGRISHTEMTEAIASGTARTLSRTITDIARYQTRWWLYDRDEWIPADDPTLIADLDAAAAIMASVDQQASQPRQRP